MSLGGDEVGVKRGGLVLRGTREGGTEPVAIKVLLPGLLADRRDAERFEQEVAMLERVRRNRITALVSAGNFEDDVAVMRAVIDSGANVPVLACVAAGVHRFRTAMGESAEGIIGPSQWEYQFEEQPELGPSAINMTEALPPHVTNSLSEGATCSKIRRRRRLAQNS